MGQTTTQRTEGKTAGRKIGADPVDRTAHLIKLASKATARALQIRLAKDSVAYGHWTFLRILWKEDGLSVTELSDRASVMKPAAVYAVRAMEELGYVVRGQKSGNRKKVYIHLTPLGRALEAKLVPLAVEVNDIALRGLDERQAGELKLMLSTILRNLAEDDAGSAEALPDMASLEPE